MAYKRSKQVAAGAQVPNADDGYGIIAVTAEYTVKTGDALGDIVEMHGIPSNAVVVDLIVDQDGLGGTIDVGVLSGEFAKNDATRTMGSEFMAASSVAATGLVRPTKSFITVAQSLDERGWGVKFLAAPTVGKTVRATLYVRPAPVAMNV